MKKACVNCHWYFAAEKGICTLTTDREIGLVAAETYCCDHYIEWWGAVE